MSEKLEWEREWVYNVYRTLHKMSRQRGWERGREWVHNVLQNLTTLHKMSRKFGWEREREWVHYVYRTLQLGISPSIYQALPGFNPFPYTPF